MTLSPAISVFGIHVTYPGYVLHNESTIEELHHVEYLKR
ncbi:MAG: hypothetical protein ACI92E_002955 [Oceanicoccus sp.]|jgi:hypothetical protein